MTSSEGNTKCDIAVFLVLTVLQTCSALNFGRTENDINESKLKIFFKLKARTFFGSVCVE